MLGGLACGAAARFPIAEGEAPRLYSKVCNTPGESPPGERKEFQADWLGAGLFRLFRNATQQGEKSEFENGIPY